MHTHTLSRVQIPLTLWFMLELCCSSVPHWAHHRLHRKQGAVETVLPANPLAQSPVVSLPLECDVSFLKFCTSLPSATFDFSLSNIKKEALNTLRTSWVKRPLIVTQVWSWGTNTVSAHSRKLMPLWQIYRTHKTRVHVYTAAHAWAKTASVAETSVSASTSVRSSSSLSLQPPHILHTLPSLSLVSCHPPLTPPAEWYMHSLGQLYSLGDYLKYSYRESDMAAFIQNVFFDCEGDVTHLP